MIMNTSLVLSMQLSYTNYTNRLTMFIYINGRWFEKHCKIYLCVYASTVKFCIVYLTIRQHKIKYPSSCLFRDTSVLSEYYNNHFFQSHKTSHFLVLIKSSFWQFFYYISHLLSFAQPKHSDLNFEIVNIGLLIFKS